MDISYNPVLEFYWNLILPLECMHAQSSIVTFKACIGYYIKFVWYNRSGLAGVALFATNYTQAGEG